jgi:hypothetical protein
MKCNKGFEDIQATNISFAREHSMVCMQNGIVDDCLEST